MKKKMYLVLCAVASFVMLSSMPVMAQGPRGDRPQQEEVDKLTVAQTTKVNQILEKYDSKSLSADDAKAIIKALREAKIPRGKGVEKAIDAAGFDFEEIRKLAPPPSRPERGGPRN